MVQESRCWRDEAASRDWAHARPDRALCLVHVLVVVGNLPVASVLAGNKHIVDNAIHDVATLGSGAVTFWELVAARRANGIPLRTLENGRPEGVGADGAVEYLHAHGDILHLTTALSILATNSFTLVVGVD